MARWLGVVAIVLTAASVDAQTVVPHEDRTLTIRAEDIPIATLLSAIARVSPIARVTIQAGAEQRPVSIVLERVDPGTALVAILRASGLDFAVSGRRAIVGEWNGPAKAEALALRTSSDEPPSRPAEGRAEHTAAERAAEAEQQATTADIDNESTILPTPPVAFIANGENVTYLEPNFVPYKMRPEVRALRMAIDVATIP